MASVTLKDQSGADKGKCALDDAVFGVEANLNAVRAALNCYLGNQRSGTAKTKSRGEVAGSNAKPWRQKGTGRARAGTIRSPLWEGGAIVFGPIPRSYRSKLNKKVRRGALRSVMSQRLKDNAVTVLDSLKIDAPKTRQVVQLLDQLGLTGKSALIVAEGVDTNLLLSARNLPKVAVRVPESLNVYDLLRHECLILTRAAAEKIGEIYGPVRRSLSDAAKPAGQARKSEAENQEGEDE